MNHHQQRDIMADALILMGIEFYAYGGVTEAEKQVGQRYSVDLEVALDLSEAARTDSLETTVSYADIYTTVIETALERRYNLLEGMAGRIVERLLAGFPLESVTIELRKLLPPIEGTIAYSAVRLTRRAEDRSG
jgi:dihydroneopterin aldolase